MLLQKSNKEVPLSSCSRNFGSVYLHLQLVPPDVPQNHTSILTWPGQNQFLHHLPPNFLRLMGAVPTAPPQKGEAHLSRALASPSVALWKTTWRASEREQGEIGHQTT